MNDTMLLLAQGTTDTNAMESLRGIFTRMDILSHPDELLTSLSQMPIVLASVFVVVGLMCVLNGYNWHKWVVIILAFLGGIALGNLLSSQLGKSSIVAFAIGALCAIIATPMLKITIALFGGLTGAFLGANAWTAFNTTQPEAHWAGAAMGFIILAMSSFILFKLVIVLFTSIGGAAMFVLGGLTLLLQVNGWEDAIRNSLIANERILPLLVAVGAVSGFVLQQSRIHAEAKEAES